jgi:hypothetical protein
MMEELLIGLDIGTSSVKAVLTTPEGRTQPITPGRGGPNRPRRIGGRESLKRSTGWKLLRMAGWLGLGSAGRAVVSR